MTTTSLFNVPTAVLLDQAAFTLDELRAAASAPIRDALRASGFDVDDYITRLSAAIDAGNTLEAEQERAKAAVDQEREEDRALAQQGYRWIQRLHARLRMAEARGAMPGTNLGRRYRLAALRRPRVRGVLYKLRILLPELAGDLAALHGFGVTRALYAEGQHILDALTQDRRETAAAISTREQLTVQVREIEATITALLRELRAARDIAALDTGRTLTGFSLQILRAYNARSRGDSGSSAPDLDEADDDLGLDALDPEDDVD